MTSIEIKTYEALKEKLGQQAAQQLMQTIFTLQQAGAKPGPESVPTTPQVELMLARMKRHLVLWLAGLWLIQMITLVSLFLHL
ncbi:hypothetical protein [Larkinella punicea]|uniref:Uncharacterized protein n=1 Tax=Larkinella punicea TaxID=2315727 RepID=A0A368JK78_9BACT|nr:hypothetical protein [Larkinella punicea]RCR67456.1 hypothetical protein DUE52_21890 [Larkinella punicea]